MQDTFRFNNKVSKLPNVGTTIFTVMSKLATEEKAINLSQGFPDFPIDAQLVALMDQYMKLNFNQYAPMAGLLRLRENIATKIGNHYLQKVSAEEEITVTAGATQAIYTAISALIHKDDEVIIFEPAYDSYSPGILLNGGKVQAIPLNTPDFSIPWDKVKATINERTKMIIINSPHNPSGTMMTTDDIQALKEITKGTNIIIISDEVYEHLVYDGQKHISLLDYPELYERSLVCYSFGKTFHITGWKIGYCVAPPLLTTEFRKAHQFNVFCVHAPSQHALAEYLEDESNYNQLANFYQAKRDYFLDLLKETKFQFTPSKGTYFQLVDYSAYSDEKDTDFAIRLTKEYGVASIPLSPFYTHAPNQKLIRLCFAKKESTLKAAAEKLVKVENV